MPVIMKEGVQYAYTEDAVKAHTLSLAEYNALTEAEKMNGDLYLIPDKQPDGTNPASRIDDLEDEVSELKSNKQDKIADNYEDLNFTLPTTAWNGHYVVDVDRVTSLNKRVFSIIIIAMQNNRPASCQMVGNQIRVTSPTTANTAGFTGTVRVYYF